VAPLAVFRCDASPELGGGHVARCLALADAVASTGWRTAFAVGPGTKEVVPRLSAASAEVRTIDGKPDALASAWPEGAGLLVVDHYGLDARFERGCRPWAKRVLAVDDLADREHDADWLVDPTPGHEAALYQTRVPAACQIAAGARFAPIRPEFLRRREQALARRVQSGPVRRILVSMGTTDPANATMVALEALSIAKLGAEIDVVLGAAAPHRAEILRRLPENARLSLDVADMADRIAAADIAIGAGGVSALERCCLGLPTVTIVIADNQRGATVGISHAGAALVLSEGPPSAGAVADAIRRLADDKTRRAMSAAAARLCDGRGIARLLVTLAGFAETERTEVSLGLAEEEDRSRLLAWQREPGSRRYARNPAMPSDEEHDRWFSKALSDPDRILCIVRAGGVPCGMLRLDRLQNEKPAFEVSILVAAAFRGRGLGRAALALARRLAPGARLDAEIHPENAASQKMFAAAGYARMADNLFRSLAG
jgi:UDP-2,4-diacetamido-2,4,6-trideoxy-beta-L-altropyranose hydrolase